ncbi:hypothetical protein Cgig2_007013 [Carnegiea gigantea]|uniref:Thiol-disulfide oxidoreductase DCC n=1 Tax=Carnegiea gigantea TaxID=171969 RepID=A0A9Q1K8T8_9CARY|nr:hypothetical protein Cgig2_007013 [Carnegiea gigantea]
MRVGFQIRNVVRASLNSTQPAAATASSSSPKPPAAPLSATAGAVADIAGDDDDDLEIIAKPPDTVSKSFVSPNVLQPRVLVYDGVCHLCHTGVKWIIKADKYRKIKFCCVQSKRVEPYLKLCDVEREDVLRQFIFIEGLGEYHRASTGYNLFFCIMGCNDLAAALKVLSYLPFPYSALSSLLIIPTPLRDAVYDYTAKRRYDWCGKVEDCLVLQEPDLLERFIDREEILEKLRSDS